MEDDSIQTLNKNNEVILIVKISTEIPHEIVSYIILPIRFAAILQQHINYVLVLGAGGCVKRGVSQGVLGVRVSPTLQEADGCFLVASRTGRMKRCPR